MVEATLMLHVWSFAKEMSFKFIEVEDDAIIIINKMNNVEADFSSTCNIIEDAKGLIHFFYYVQI